jgi:NTP pyrophosphatase (non-canonical NTP hydrolase)
MSFGQEEIDEHRVKVARNVADFAFFSDAFAELKSARAKFPGEEREYAHESFLRVVVEEVGECARELNEAADHGRPVDVALLRGELVQVSAMAARWAGSDAMKEEA